ncbi:MAG: hypothetical protein U0821_25435 [Chloroflexota bacterium]
MPGVRFNDPESLIVAALGAVLLVACLGGPVFGLPGWSRMGVLLGFVFLWYGVSGLRRGADDDEDGGDESGSGDS